jgi:hypothetical protein
MRKLSVVVFSLWSIGVAAAQPESPESPAFTETVGAPPNVVAGEAAPAVTPYRPVPALPEAKRSGGIHPATRMREWWLWVAGADGTDQESRFAINSATFFRDWFNTFLTIISTTGTAAANSPLQHTRRGAVAEAIFWQNDHVRFSEQDFWRTQEALPEAFAFATVDAVLWKWDTGESTSGRWPSSSLVGRGLQSAPHSLRRPDRRERYGDERVGRDGDDHRLHWLDKL